MTIAGRITAREACIYEGCGAMECLAVRGFVDRSFFLDDDRVDRIDE